MPDDALKYFTWALALGAVSAVSLPLGSWIGLRVRFSPRTIAVFAAFGAGALIAALSVELVAPTAMALTESSRGTSKEHAFADFAALLIGSVVGGLLFVALDRIVNQQGGYLRKASATLEHLAKRRRESVKQLVDAVLAVPPFDSLGPGLAPTIAGMLRPENYREGQLILGPGREPTACILLEGEVVVEFGGKPAKSFGPGTMLGVLAVVAPGMTSLGTIRAKTNVRCLSLSPDDMRELKARCPEFDAACRGLAAERLGELEQLVTTRLSATVEWARTASEALRQGHELPALEGRSAHAGHEGSPLAVWLGILLDGIPESIVIGAGLFTAILAAPADQELRFFHVVPYTLIAGLFLSNLPEALSSSANMLSAGWGSRRIFLMWFALMVITAIGSGLGFLLAGVLTETWLVFAEGVAAGAMLTMIAAAMIPEAAAHGAPSSVGLSTLAGFLAAVSFKVFE